MSRKVWSTLAVKLKAIVFSLLSTTTLVTPASAQNFSFFYPSPDQATAPTGLAATINNQLPIAPVNAITGFGRTFGFGSSSTDTRSSVPVLPGYGDRFSNGNAVYIELFAPLIGATDRPGSTTPLANPPPTNFGIAGTNATTAQVEVPQFAAAYGRFAPNDIAVMWSGINDFSGGSVNAGTFAAIAANDVAQQTVMVNQLLNLGARNLFILGLPQVGTFQFRE
jgi:hypothetical protein